MSNRIIFISCGQYTQAEKALGKAIVNMVDEIPGLKAYFAEEVQDLNGLDSNILSKLHECEAFITVLHPRGNITRPDGTMVTRASVWIEQEIAIATYIRQIEKRPIRVIAFRQKSVSLEGIRTLLQLNPIEFTNETEVLEALPALLEGWKSLPATGIRLAMNTTKPIRHENQHAIRQLKFSIVNDSSKRITEISGELRIPAGILKHWTHQYGLLEQPIEDDRYRTFRFTEQNLRPIEPRTTINFSTFDYCIQCAIDNTGEGDLFGATFVSGQEVKMTVWINGIEYELVRTLKEMSMEVGESSFAPVRQ
jgi:hypothetical protein